MEYLLLGVAILVGLGSLLYFLLWLWMLIDCIRREPDRYFWVWLLIVVPFPGAIIYAVTRFFPQSDVVAPTWLRAWTQGKELARRETAAQQIGNAHQFIQWGDLLREVGKSAQAADAYRQALSKDPKSLPALWGAAQVAIQRKEPQVVKDFCRQILELDPQYKFGDVSLAYARALYELGETAALRTHLEGHVRRWRHPEGVYLLAKHYLDAGYPAAAREQGLALLRDVNGSPPAIARKFGRWKSLTRRLLKSCP